MWIWHQRDGQLWRDGTMIARGYSGYGGGRNNPERQAEVGIGPCPRGRWTIGAPYHSANTGPYTLTLTACVGTATCGRSAFRIHGDNKAHTASRGCIILPRPIREMIWRSGDRDLEVVA